MNTDHLKLVYYIKVENIKALLIRKINLAPKQKIPIKLWSSNLKRLFLTKVAELQID